MGVSGGEAGDKWWVGNQFLNISGRELDHTLGLL